MGALPFLGRGMGPLLESGTSVVSPNRDRPPKVGFAAAKWRWTERVGSAMHMLTRGSRERKQNTSQVGFQRAALKAGVASVEAAWKRYTPSRSRSMLPLKVPSYWVAHRSRGIRCLWNRAHLSNRSCTSDEVVRVQIQPCAFCGSRQATQCAGAGPKISWLEYSGFDQ